MTKLTFLRNNKSHPIDGKLMSTAEISQPLPALPPSIPQRMDRENDKGSFQHNTQSGLSKSLTNSNHPRTNAGDNRWSSEASLGGASNQSMQGNGAHSNNSNQLENGHSMTAMQSHLPREPSRAPYPGSGSAADMNGSLPSERWPPSHGHAGGSNQPPFDFRQRQPMNRGSQFFHDVLPPSSGLGPLSEPTSDINQHLYNRSMPPSGDSGGALSYGGHRQIFDLQGQPPSSHGLGIGAPGTSSYRGHGNGGGPQEDGGSTRLQAAGIVAAAAAAAERDYHFATLNLQRQLAAAADLAEKRQALRDLSASVASGRGSVKDDVEVAHACLHLGADGKDGDYPPNALDPAAPNGRFGGGGNRPVPGADPSSALLGRGSGELNMGPYSSNSSEILMGNLGMNSNFMNGQHHLDPYLPQDAHHGSMRGLLPQVLGKRKNTASSFSDFSKKMKTLDGSQAPQTKPIEPKKGKRPADMPRRPLSAYNFFFSEERERVLASLPSPDEKDENESKDNEDSKEENESDEAKKGDTEEKESKGAEAKKESDSSSTSKETQEGTSDSKSHEPSKNPSQSNTERLLSLRMVQQNVRRPHRKTHGKIGFKALAKLIGERWRALSSEKKEPYRKLAETDLARYKEQMEEYNRKNKWSFLQEKHGGEKPPGSPS